MKPNTRLEEVLKSTPQELKQHYINLLSGDSPSNLSDLPIPRTLSELLIEQEAMPVLVVPSTGWKNLDTLAAGGIAPGEVCLLAAEAGAGKTHFAVNLAMNYAAQDKRVFYLTMEDGWYQILERFKTLERRTEARDNIFMIHEDELTVENALDTLRQVIDICDLIIVDNLFALPLKQNAKGDYWTSQAEWVDDLCSLIRSSTCSCLILHHLNKSKEQAQRYLIAGSTRLVNRVAQVWLLTRGKEQDTMIALHCEKNRRSPHKGECFLQSDTHGRLHMVDVGRDVREAAESIFNQML